MVLHDLCVCMCVCVCVCVCVCGYARLSECVPVVCEMVHEHVWQCVD